MFNSDRNIKCTCIPSVKPGEHSICTNVSVWFPPPVKFVITIVLRCGICSFFYSSKRVLKGQNHFPTKLKKLKSRVRFTSSVCFHFLKQNTDLDFRFPALASSTSNISFTIKMIVPLVPCLHTSTF